MINKRDYYSVLELTPSCTLQDIRKSFRRLALKWHPDKCLEKLEAEVKFNEIHEAYSILSDVRKKKIYDTYGHEGLSMDEKCNDFADMNKEHSFFKKGFQGTEKSAFDILRDIFEENDDEYFFQNYEDFGISQNLQSTMRDFIQDNIFSNEEKRGNGFFENYKPTFMDPDFFMEPPEFPEMEFENECTQHFFSSFLSTSGNQTFSRTSTTFIQNGNVKTSTKETFQKGKSFFEKEETNQYTQKNHTNNFNTKMNFDSFYPQKTKEPSYIIIDDEVRNDPMFNYYQNSGSSACYFNDFDDNEFLNEAVNKHKMCSPSKKISKNKESVNIRLVNKKPSKKNRN
jgi:curved DNA-binding protein CbpA